MIALVALEAGWRALRDRPPGIWSARLSNIAVLAVVIASAGGLGILLGGGTPTDSLHFVYGAIAILALPLTSSLSRRMRPRPAATALLIVAVALLVVVLRLFQTG